MEQDRTVRVTTKAELDAALRSADVIVVEGASDALVRAVELFGPPDRRSPHEDRALLSLGLVIALLAIAVGAIADWLGPGGRAALARLHLPDLPTSKEALSTAAGRAALVNLAWPALAIIAVIVLYVLLRQTIASGSDPGARWEVTEGRIVLTRGGPAAPRGDRSG